MTVTPLISVVVVGGVIVAASISKQLGLLLAIILGGMLLVAWMHTQAQKRR